MLTHDDGKPDQDNPDLASTHAQESVTNIDAKTHADRKSKVVESKSDRAGLIDSRECYWKDVQERVKLSLA